MSSNTVCSVAGEYPLMCSIKRLYDVIWQKTRSLFYDIGKFSIFFGELSKFHAVTSKYIRLYNNCKIIWWTFVMAIRNYVGNPAGENNYFVSDYSFLSGSENQNMAVRNEKKKSPRSYLQTVMICTVGK